MVSPARRAWFVACRTVAFRYSGDVTVPGKGGRPRKWRSDADRVRAYRARQRGEEEPATFEKALDEGDELALAVERSRILQAELATAVEALGDLQGELAAERRRTLTAQRRRDRTLVELDTLHAAAARQASEIDALRAEVADLRAENAALRGRLDDHRQSSPSVGPNRAARREAAKRDRRNS
jgi:chromosome segregation ATPase